MDEERIKQMATSSNYMGGVEKWARTKVPVSKVSESISKEIKEEKPKLLSFLTKAQQDVIDKITNKGKETRI